MVLPGWINIVFYCLVGIVVLVFFGVLIYYILMFKRHNRRCEVWVYDPNIKQIVDRRTDRGGIYTKHGMKLFHLWKSKTSIAPEKVSSIPDKHGFISYFVQAVGSKTIAPVSMELGKNFEFNIDVGEEDVNWAIMDYERHKNALASKNILLQLLPYMAIALIAVICLVGAVYLLKKFDVLVEISSNLKDVAITNKEVTEQLRMIAENLKPTQVILT